MDFTPHQTRHLNNGQENIGYHIKFCMKFINRSNKNDSLIIDLVTLFTLSSFAVAQPVLDIIAKNSSFLIAHDTGTTGVFLLIAILLFLPPAIPVIIQSVMWFISKESFQDFTRFFHFPVSCIIIFANP